MSLDVLLVVPVEPPIAHIVDPVVRRTSGARLHGPLSQALHEFEYYIGRSVSLNNLETRPHFGGEAWPPQYEARGPSYMAYRGTQPPRRTLASVTLASEFERASLSWRIFDPGVQDLSYWRKRFMEVRAQNPAAVAVCTTFIICEPWLRALTASIREILPHTKILVGGYYYAVNVKKFLSLDADVFGVGEGEVRLSQMVAAIKGRGRLEDIPGLYIRQPDGSLLHTGHAEQLDMNDLKPVDWGLADRIEPYIDMKEVPVATWVETQRGCVFKCEFCDYRTIQTPAALSVEKAVEAILNAAVSPKGMVRITDSTATFPRARWEAIMEGLIARNGSPVPLWCFARVNDLTESATALMGKANVRHVFVGQESGDQRILQEMRKGTSVKHVKPAVDNLGRNGISGTFSFIHGFPGENSESIVNTRRMICGINDGFESKPVVLQYLAQPLVMFELSTVGKRQDTTTSDHWLDYQAGEFTPRRAMDEVLETIMAVSRVPHAPVYMLMPGSFIGNWEEFFFFSPHRYEIFGWLKAVERGIAIFLERSLVGTKPDDRELSRLRDRVVRHLPPANILERHKARLQSRIQRRLMGRMVEEWDAEVDSKPGLMTRGLVASSVFRDIGRPGLALEAARRASYPDIGVARSVEVREQERDPQHATTLDRLAAKLVDESIGAVQRDRQKAAAHKLARDAAVSK